MSNELNSALILGGWFLFVGIAILLYEYMGD